MPGKGGALVIALIAALSLIAVPRSARLDPTARQTVEYHITHPFHDVTGVAHKVQGEARLLPDGSIEGEVRVPFSAFATGNENRDANARATLETDRFPDILVKAVVKAPPPKSYPGTVTAQADLEVAFHGVTHSRRVPLTIEWQSPDQARVTGAFDVSLTAHHVRRPALLFVPIGDRVRIDFNLVFRAEAMGSRSLEGGPVEHAAGLRVGPRERPKA